MYNTINELATIIKVAIDAYWRLEKNRDDLLKEIEEIFDEPKHCGIALRGMAFSATYEQRLGKKRSQFLKEMLNQINSEKFHFD